MLSDLYYNIVRSLSLGLEPIYDNFKLRIKDDKVYIVGFVDEFYRQKFIHPIKLIVDGNILNFDMDSIHTDISKHIGYGYRDMLRFSITLLNVENLTSDIFYHKKEYIDGYVIKLNLPNTKKLSIDSIPLHSLKYLIAPNVVDIDEGFCAARCLKVLILNKYNKTSLVFSHFRIINYIKLAPDFVLSSKEFQIQMGSSSRKLYVLLSSLYSETLTYQQLLYVLEDNISEKICFKSLIKLENETNSKFKGVRVCFHNKYIFEKLLYINLNIINCHINTIILKELKYLKMNTFIDCFITELVCEKLEFCEQKTFVDTEIIRLNLSNLKVLNVDIFYNCRIGELFLSSDCQVIGKNVLDTMVEEYIYI